MAAAPQSIGTIDTGVSRHMGVYSDAVVIPPGMVQVVLSGTPGLRSDGTRPDDFAEETRQAWENVREALLCAGAELSDIVQVRTWLTNADDMETYVEIRKEIIGHKPALMLAVVPQLVRPSFRLEIEVVAAVASTSTTAAGQDE